MIPSLYLTWFIKTHFLYSYISFLYAMLSRNLLKLHSATSKNTIGRNAYKNEMVAYLHMTWPNHAKVIKAASPRAALMKGTYLNRPTWVLLIWYPDKWKEHMQLLQKLLSNFIEKTQKTIYLFFKFKIYMISAPSWNELKL